MGQNLILEDNKNDKFKYEISPFEKIYDYYKQKQYTFLQVKMVDGTVFNIAINDLIYWTYSVFFCYFTKNNITNKYEVNDSGNVFKYSYPCPNYSLEETKNLLISKNSSLGLSVNDMFHIIMDYLHKNKQQQIYDKVLKSNIYQIDNFITFSHVYSSINVETKDYNILFNSKNILYDLMININEIISIMPLKYEFELLEIKDDSLLKLINAFELKNTENTNK